MRWTPSVGSTAIVVKFWKTFKIWGTFAGSLSGCGGRGVMGQDPVCPETSYWKVMKTA